MTAKSIKPSPAEGIRPIDRSTLLLLVQLLSQVVAWLIFFVCFTFAIYLPKREETPQTNGFSTQNHRSALRMFLKEMFWSTNPYFMCKNSVCSTSRENSSKSSIKFSTLMSNFLEDSEKPLVTERIGAALQLLVPYGVYFFIMIMVMIIMMDIA